ncbi:MAG: membrane protein insertase YidC [Bradymonadaceae bacterium]
MQQKRLVLAMMLSAGVLVLWQMFFAPEPPASPDKPGTEPAAAGDTTGAAPTPDTGGTERATSDRNEADAAAKAETSADPTDAPEAESSTPSPSGNGSAAAKSEPKRVTHTLKTRRLKVGLTNVGGGRVESIELLRPEQYRKEGDLLKKIPEGTSQLPFGLDFIEGTLPLDDSANAEFVESQSVRSKNGTWKKVVYRYTDAQGRFVVDKIFSTSPDAPYLLDFDVVVRNTGDAARTGTPVLDNYRYHDPNQETSWLNFRPNNIEGVCRLGSEIRRAAYPSVDNPKEYDKSEVLWGGIDTRYFLVGAIPAEPAESCRIEKIGEGYLRTRMIYDSFSVAAGETHRLEHELYLGPKDVDIMSEIGHHLTDSVDYGFFAFVARPLRWSLNHIQGLVGNWGLAIILLTIIIKLLTWPINMKAYRSMQGMKEIQPQLEEIQEEYEDDQQKLYEETQKLFRENDVSPLGGCLPMLLQMPILYGLFVMIYNSVELYQADFIFWYTNLAAPDPYYVLPVVMGLVMLGQQQFMSGASANPQAKIMTKVMPVMFTAFMLFLPAGLVLYYSVNLIIGLGQQLYIRMENE